MELFTTQLLRAISLFYPILDKDKERQKFNQKQRREAGYTSEAANRPLFFNTAI